MTEHTQHLVEIIDLFLAERCDFNTFSAQYEDYLLDTVPAEYLNACELLVLSEVHERAEWTTTDPPSEDRLVGWISVGHCRMWLAAYRESLPRLLPGRGILGPSDSGTPAPV
jgi:hypothetical protein